MAERAVPNKIVFPVAERTGLRPPARFVGQSAPAPGPQPWAPAWFYSALNWLGRSFIDASGALQAFGPLLAGSDVDPYARLGATRLFLVTKLEDVYLLTIAADTESDAPLRTGSRYPDSDAGITAMYQALAQSPAFAAVRYCYVPGLGADLRPDRAQYSMPAGGYDPATGLRLAVLGSAVAQVVPLDQFADARNAQIYDDSPTIVALATSLVFDVTSDNELGATTFQLPQLYSRDQVGPENYYVNRLAGPTVSFAGGAGYDPTAATALTLASTTTTSTAAGQTRTSYTYDSATVVSTEPLEPSARIGIGALSYSGSAPSQAFAQQQIIGFYRDASWTNCLGVPIYDYGTANASFTATAAELAVPVNVYDPTAPFLNGGSLPNVSRNLAQAEYLYSTDRLVSILDSAIAAQDNGSGAGLSVMGAALAFDTSSDPAASIVDELAIPVLATVTSTPTALERPPTRRVAATGDAQMSDQPLGLVDVLRSSGGIGAGANTPTGTQPGPVTVQVGLTATIPQEALTGTGISTIEIGTQFPLQALGSVPDFQSASAGVVVNLMDRHPDQPPVPPFELDLGAVDLTLLAGVVYVLSTAGDELIVRGGDGSSTTAQLGESAPAGEHSFVGSLVYEPSRTTVTLYPKLSFTVAAPAVGANGVEQGASYSVRLTYGAKQSSCDVLDAGQTVLAANLGVTNPAAADGPTPQPGDVYFGQFVGGAEQLTVWSVPIFLTVLPAQIAGIGTTGALTLEARTSGLPAYQLQITDSSLLVYTNIDVDSASIGSVSPAEVYLASAVINSAPDDGSAQAFAPSKLVLGLVRPAQVGNTVAQVFVPEADSVVIGGVRYMLGAIALGDFDADPNTRPYPPVLWPQTRYWQFANRHNPYLDVEYTGETQADRVARAQSDTIDIGLATARAREPMHLYLDTDPDQMTVWPIYAFPYATSTQTVDRGQLTAITETILGILKGNGSTGGSAAQPSGPLAGEQIAVPGLLQQENPYVATIATTPDTNPGVAESATNARASLLAGREVTNLSPGLVAQPGPVGVAPAAGLTLATAGRKTAAAADRVPVLLATSQDRPSEQRTGATPSYAYRYQPIHGFSVYNSGTGEAYVIEVVEADLDLPDQLPDPTQHADYDPFYVRVIFLNTLTCYHMSIIVPSIAYDQYGHFAREHNAYRNVLSQTDELGLGYLHSLYDDANNFDELTFNSYPPTAHEAKLAQPVIYSNVPYSTAQTASFNPLSLYSEAGPSLASKALAAELTLAAPAGNRVVEQIDRSIVYRPPVAPPAYFVCRRENWNADCHLMQATHPADSSIYLAFGAGDIVPFRLDAEFTIDKRQPAHLYKLTETFADRRYDSAQTISVSNTPYVVGVTTDGGVTQYTNFSLDAAPGTGDVQVGANQPLQFPDECYVVGQASTTLTSMNAINALLGTALTDTGDLQSLDGDGTVIAQFQVLAYNNLVYVIRVVGNCGPLGAVGGLGTTAGLLIDTFVPATSGNLKLAQGARYKRSGLPFFGASYTPTTMVDSLDTLDFTSITGETFYAPTVFVPIPELDAGQAIVANLSNFLGQQIWTFVYPEIVVEPAGTANGRTYPGGFNLDAEGKPILSLQKLQFIYDPIVVLFTPNDLSHKYQVQPKQQVLALTNGQIREGICWRSANGRPQRPAPSNVCAQQILPDGPGMDRPNIIYSAHNRAVATPAADEYLGMSVHSLVSLSGAVYNIEESAMSNDQTGTSFISAVSSTQNMVLGVLFDYDNDDLGTLDPYDPTASTKGIVFLNGYLGAAGFSFSSPDHLDVNDVLPSQVPLLEQVAGVLGEHWDVAMYNTDVSLPRQFWSLTYDTFTAAGLPNYITDLAPAIADPSFLNRTRSLLLNIQNPVRPDQLGLMDTYSSVVSANVHLQNGVTGGVFLSKKADRDVASIGTNPSGPTSYPLYGLPTKYDFFLFSRDHYWTLKGASFELIDQGYAMCLVDDGSGTGNKVAKYFVDTDGNYNELYSYVLYAPGRGILETATFTVKVTLGAPGQPGATPSIAETPNNINPQDLVTQLNKVSNLIYAAFGPSTPGQPPAYLPIQAVAGEVQAAPILGAPGFNGYQLNVVAANRQPVTITQLYSGAVTYPIAGSTTAIPFNVKAGKAVPFYGSLSHGLDRQLGVPVLQSGDLSSYIPRPTVPAGPSTGLYGGNGLGALIGTPFSYAFQGAGAIPPATAADPTPGTTMKADDTVFYSVNAVANTVMDSTGKSATIVGGQYFIDQTDPGNPVYAVVTSPKFSFNGNTYTVNLATTLADGVTSRYSLVVGGRSHLFGPDNAHVSVDSTIFTFNAIAGGAYTVSCAAGESPAGVEAPSPIALTPFAITAGGLTATIDVFNNPGGLEGIVLGVEGRTYGYQPVAGTVTVSAGAASTTAALRTGLIFASSSGYGYVVGLAESGFTMNGAATYPYAATTTGAPASYLLMTSPEMFTIDGNFYTFDQTSSGAYVAVTGNGQTYPINPYQFTIAGTVYIINTNVTPNTVIGGGNAYPMTAGNTQFEIDGVQYTIALKGNSLNGATVSGQFNISQGNVVVIEDYAYLLDTLNGQIVGNGTTYPLTTSGFTYAITTSSSSFTVTTEPNATTVTIGGVDYLINNTTVVGDGVTYPILAYRTFTDGPESFVLGRDGTVSLPTPFALSGAAPFTRSTFTDGGATYTVNDAAAFDGIDYFLLSGSPAQFTAGAHTYTLRPDGVSIAAGPAKTYLIDAAGPVSPNSFAFGTETVHFGRAGDLAAFDGQHYYAIANGQFTDTNTALTYTIAGNVAVNEGNSYEIFSNLGAGPYFEIPGGPTYYVNIAVADTGAAGGDIFSVFPITGGQFTIPLAYTIAVAGSVVTLSGTTFTGGATAVPTLTADSGQLTGGYFTDPITNITYTCVVDGASTTFVDANNAVFTFPSVGAGTTLVVELIVTTAVPLAVDNQAPQPVYPVLNNQFITATDTYTVNVPVAHAAAAGPYLPMVNGRFIVAQADPVSAIAYTVQGGSVVKGYVVSADDQFSPDGDVVYTVDAVNVVKAGNQAGLTTAGGVQTLTAGSLVYTLDAAAGQATLQSSGTVFPYTNLFFTDVLNGVTYYIDEGAGTAEAVSYLPQTTRYGFTPADGTTYLIHYNDVTVVFPVVAGAAVNVGEATVGSDRFDVHADAVDPVGGRPPIPTNRNSFEINGNLYTITGTPAGADYSGCQVVGAGQAARNFASADTFVLGDPSVTYTLQLDDAARPSAVVADFPVQPSRDLISVADDVYLISYTTTTTGALLGQGQSAIPISNSAFTVTSGATKSKFVFADLDIYDAASVVGQFPVSSVPTFFLGGQTFTLDPVNLVVTDADKRPYPLVSDPAMFSINGANYLIDANRLPHAVVGNGEVSPLATDVTVQAGRVVANTTFTLGGLEYAYVEDAGHHLLAIVGTKSYLISQPAQTFKLDSSLLFTIVAGAPAAGNYAGTTVPVATVTAAGVNLNVYAGTPESGGGDYFLYKNVLYTLVKSESTYVAVQKAYTVYHAQPTATQQQLGVFDLAGTTYLLTDGTTAGDATPAGLNPATMWAQSSTSNVETQFGLVYGFGSTPGAITRSGTGVFQFPVTDSKGTVTLYDVLYADGANTNMVKVDVPALLPSFTQSAPFTFTASYPLTFETGGYNAFTTFVQETATPVESFAGAYKTPVVSRDSLVDSLITAAGDFSLEFWHSIPTSTPAGYHPATYSASTTDPLVYHVDVDFEDSSNIFVGINGSVLHAAATPPVFSSKWRHVALTYSQPYTMLCQGAGFEVKQASSYDLNRDFSLALTFAAQDVTTRQGLLYKGTGSDNSSPETNMSYRVAIEDNAVTLTLTDGSKTISPVFRGAAALQAGLYYQAIIVKHTSTPAGREDSADPYAAPFDTSDLGPAAAGGATMHASSLPTDGGPVTVSNIAPAGVGATTKSAALLQQLANPSPQAYQVDIAVRTVNDDGSFGSWQIASTPYTVPNGDPGLLVNPTGNAHLLIGAAYDDDAVAMPLGTSTSPGNVRDVYLFNGAINREGITTTAGVVDIARASANDLAAAGIVGHWSAQYDPDGVVDNSLDATAVAISTNSAAARLAPLTGHEFEATALYVNGYQMTLSLVTGAQVPSSMPGYSAGSSLLLFNGGLYKLQEISVWSAARADYQILNDMFGRLVPTNEPDLVVYLSGSFEVPDINTPILPMNKYIDNVAITNPVTSMDLAFSPASLDLSGSPAVGRCGPLITPNLYTPPGVALTVCDAPPSMTTYSVTLNSVTGTLAGELNEAYVYIKDNVLTLYTGKKVGDLVLSWVSQEQGDVQLIGYVEGAPPAPMANLTNKASYAGATSLTFTAPTSVTLKFQTSSDSSVENKTVIGDAAGFQVGLKANVSPLGVGLHMGALELDFSTGLNVTVDHAEGGGTQKTASEKLDESNKYTVKLEGAMSPYTNDLFMSSLNTLTTPSNTVGNPASKTAILPNPDLGGFTTSNPPGQLPRTAPTEEKFGARMYAPSPYGQAFVTSQTLDVYQQTLLQSNTVYGFVRVPDPQIPRDLNIVSFRLSSRYLRPGVLDGVIGYGYNPATLPTGAQTYTTSTGELEPLYDGNFNSGEVGHNASYMRVVEAYMLKKQIDQQAFNALARYHTAYYDPGTAADDPALTPGLDFYNEYVWSARGGTQEVKHTYTTTFDEVYNTTTSDSTDLGMTFNLKLIAGSATIINADLKHDTTWKSSSKTSYNTTGTSSFDIAASFDGVETDTQMRYASANDAHFVMNNNSMFNPSNDSGLNLVIGSDGLVYNITPSVHSGRGLPLSDDIDDSQTYTQPQPAYTSGNADGLTGNLEPYDRPGKVALMRTLAFFLQPTEQNADDFWSTVVDPVWLANSPEADADAMRSAAGNLSIPWRVLYRVTHAERYLPPVSVGSLAVPQIEPVVAIPVLDAPADFLYQTPGGNQPRPARNPANDLEANIVLAVPTASGQGVGTAATTGPNVGQPVPANNVIPLDLVKSTTPVVNWGDSANVKILGQLLTSVLGLNTVPMSAQVLAGSTKIADVSDPAGGGTLYTIYLDPNGATVNVPIDFGTTVYQDVNGNPIQYYDGKTFHSLQADYIPSPDGTVMYYVQPPDGYDPSAFDLLGDYDLFGHPGDQWRYYLISGFSANLTAEPTVSGVGPFLSSTGATPYTGLRIASSRYASSGANQVMGYVLAQGVLQWPALNTSAESFGDVLVYKAMSLLDTFPIGDPEVLESFLASQYPASPFVTNADMKTVFARNIVTFFNAAQQAMVPQ